MKSQDEGGEALLGAMIEIRLFEDACQQLFARGEVRGSTHLCQGQEAVSVGACHALEPGDTMTCTYRGHGAVLAMGAPLAGAFGEILGKAEGLCGGKGGSMHLTDVSVGALGSHAIVGAHLPIANGAAFASAYRGGDRAHLCFFGEGTTNIGAFHEALNLAGLWRLPVIFLCENNLYGEYSPMALTTPIERIADRAASFGFPGVRVDGNDVWSVRAAVEEALGRARAGEGPTLLEAMTYRHKGHSRTDPATYRPDGELEAWLERDPIALCERRLENAGVGAARLAELNEQARARVDAALEQARAMPDPDPADRFDHIWAA